MSQEDFVAKSVRIGVSLSPPRKATPCSRVSIAEPQMIKSGGFWSTLVLDPQSLAPNGLP